MVDMLTGVPIILRSELGTSKITPFYLLQLNRGTVIPTNKVVGEPMDIYISNQLIARGEIVVINERYGIRVSEITHPQEIIKEVKMDEEKDDETLDFSNFDGVDELDWGDVEMELKKNKEVIMNSNKPMKKEKKKKPKKRKKESINKFFKEIPIEIRIEIGRTKLNVDEILNVSIGSVIELDRLVGENLLLYAGKKIIAEGEVVVVNECYGMRITKILI